MNKFATSSRESSLCLTPTPSVATPGVPSSQMPKFGTLIPNRIFVGGISSDTSESDLKYFFSAYGPVKDCKIILDRGGISKSYGFVTFENQEDADRIIKKEGENLMFKDRKLNVGPAIRKQQTFSKICEPNLPTSGMNASAASAAAAAYFYNNGLTYAALPNTMAVLCHPDGYVLSPQTHAPAYPVIMAPQSAVGYFSSPTPGFTAGSWQSPGQWRWATASQQQAMSSGMLQAATPALIPATNGNTGLPVSSSSSSSSTSSSSTTHAVMTANGGQIMYPIAVNPDMMFAQMGTPIAAGGPLAPHQHPFITAIPPSHPHLSSSSSSSCHQSQERPDQSSSATSIQDHHNECDSSLVQGMRDGPYNKYSPPRNQNNYLY